jgi:hypothetical protein
VDLVARASWNHLHRWYGFAVSGDNPAIAREVDVSGDGIGLDLGLRGGRRRFDWHVLLKVARLDADLTGHGEPFRYTGHSTLLRLEYGVRAKLTQGFEIGGGMFVVPVGPTEARLQLSFRLQFKDWDGPSD